MKGGSTAVVSPWETLAAVGALVLVKEVANNVVIWRTNGIHTNELQNLTRL